MSRKKQGAGKQYVAVYRRDPEDEHAWLVHIEGIQGCHTFGRSLGAARRAIRDAAQLFADEMGKGAEIVDRIELPKELRGPVSEAARARAAVRAAERKRDEATRRAVKRLAAKGISTRDAGEVLDYSQQRIAQLLARHRVG